LISGLAAAGAAVVVIAIVASSGGLGSGGRHVVPELRGQRLDVAEAKLDAIGLDSDMKGGGTFGVVVESHWRVCDQEPLAGATAGSVLLVVDRECEWTVPDVTGERLKVAEATLDRDGTPYVVTYPDTARAPGASRRFTVCEEDPQYGTTTEPVRLAVNRTCELPDLTGIVLARAISRLTSAGVVAEAFTAAGHRVPKASGWRVCEQDPPPYEPALRVRLTVHRTCALPDASGLTLAAAVKKLAITGVAVEASTDAGRRVSNARGWWVCGQDPSPGDPADRVALTVRRDCGAGQPLPYVEGDSLDSARTALGEIGVPYTVVTSRYSRGVEGYYLEVCKQVPAAGETVLPGHRALLYVAGDCYSEWPYGFRK
jgi:beta-lactam-binding protein with PASTA domain